MSKRLDKATINGCPSTLRSIIPHLISIHIPPDANLNHLLKIICALIKVLKEIPVYGSILIIISLSRAKRVLLSFMSSSLPPHGLAIYCASKDITIRSPLLITHVPGSEYPIKIYLFKCDTRFHFLDDIPPPPQEN